MGQNPLKTSLNPPEPRTLTSPTSCPRAPAVQRRPELPTTPSEPSTRERNPIKISGFSRHSRSSECFQPAGTAETSTRGCFEATYGFRISLASTVTNNTSSTRKRKNSTTRIVKTAKSERTAIRR